MKVLYCFHFLFIYFILRKIFTFKILKVDPFLIDHIHCIVFICLGFSSLDKKKSINKKNQKKKTTRNICLLMQCFSRPGYLRYDIFFLLTTRLHNLAETQTFYTRSFFYRVILSKSACQSI